MYKLVSPDKIPLAQDVKLDDITDIIEAYKIATALSILCVKERGAGISAVQVGIPLKIFVVKNSLFTDDYFTGFTHYVNCAYTAVEDEVYDSFEGCLSLKDKHGELRYFIVKRPTKIRFYGKKIIAKNPLHVEDFDVILSKDDGAAVYAHETDHSFGITIDQIGEEQIITKRR